MPYSQKYCLVHFIRLEQIETDFNMSDWPLHITFVDVFAIERSRVEFDSKLQDLLKNERDFDVIAGKDSVLGTTKVTLIEKSEQLINLHNKIVGFIQSNGGILNNPEFNLKNYIPHSTVQKDDRLDEGQTVHIDHLSLVDMFPSGDWQERRVLATFKLG